MVKSFFKKYNSIGKEYYLIAVVSILLASPLFVSGLFHAHDIGYHMYKLVGLMDAIHNKEFIPLIAPKLANNFGYSWNIFYAPLSAYIPAFFKIFILSYTSSLKLFIFFTIIVSGITMYRFVLDFSGSTNVAVLSSIIYITAPYRLVDIYVRGDMGEILPFVFLPILFQGLHNLFNDDKKKSHYITIGFAGILLSHNISAFLTTIVMFIYILINYRKLRDFQVIKILVINGLLTLCISAFFIVPLLEHKLLGDYAVFLPNKMGSIEHMYQSSVYIHQLLFGTFQQGYSYYLSKVSGEMPYTLGLQLSIPLLLTPLVYRKIKEENENYIVLFILGLISVIATTNIFPWIIAPQVFSFVQFPWRILMFSVFFLSISSAKVICLLYEQIEIKHIIAIIVIIFVYISPLISMTLNDPNYTDNNFVNGDVIKDNSAVSEGCAGFEYMPVKAFKNVTYVANRKDNIILLYGETKISNEQKHGTNMTFNVESLSDSRVELPYLYYLGWKATLKSGNEVKKLDIIESDKGFVCIKLMNNEKGLVEISYEGTTYTKISYIISIITIIGFISYIILRRKYK